MAKALPQWTSIDGCVPDVQALTLEQLQLERRATNDNHQQGVALEAAAVSVPATSNLSRACQALRSKMALYSTDFKNNEQWTVRLLEIHIVSNNTLSIRLKCWLSSISAYRSPSVRVQNLHEQEDPSRAEERFTAGRLLAEINAESQTTLLAIQNASLYESGLKELLRVKRCSEVTCLPNQSHTMRERGTKLQEEIDHRVKSEDSWLSSWQQAIK